MEIWTAKLRYKTGKKAYQAKSLVDGNFSRPLVI